MRKLRLVVGTVVVATVLLAIVIELFSAFHYYLQRGKLFYLDAGEPAKQTPYTAAEAVFHPYYSFIHRVGRHGGWWTTNNMGFQVLTRLVQDEPGCCDYPRGKRGDEIIVGVFGGSAAGGFALAAQESPEFANQLGRIPSFTGKRIRVLNFAMPGFKQPQQLITLAYFLSIGQHFDVVINLDGFNEIVTTHRNWSSGAEPSFPADTLWGEWGRHVERAALAAGPAARERFLAAYLRGSATEWRRRANDCSLAACFEFRILGARAIDWRARRLEARLAKGEQKVTLFPTAPQTVRGQNIDIFDYTADVWAASSKSMADLLRPTGAVYVHVIQPNQWWRAHGAYEPIDADHIYKWVIELVNVGYPKLVAGIPRMGGVEVLDASAIYRGLPWRDVYVDDCCHYTAKGNQVLAAAIAARIARRQ
jgi:hypothetical protein